MLLSAPVTLPAAVELFSMRSSDVTILDDFHIDPFLIFRGFFLGQTQGIYNTIPMFYCGLVILIYAAIFFVNKDNKRSKVLGIRRKNE